MGKVKFKLKGKVEEKEESAIATVSLELDGDPRDFSIILVSAFQEQPELLKVIEVAVDTYRMMELMGNLGEKE